MPEEQAQRNLSAPDTEPEGSGTWAYYDKSWAVIVGINDYKEGHAPLANARNDAEAFAKLLEENLGFKKENIVTLLDDQATRDSIREWLWDELCQSGSNDRLIFFFAGHGTTGRGQLGYIVPQDADKGKYSQYISMEDLRMACHEIPAKHIFIILDCCFSGVAALSAKADLQSPEQIDDGYLTKATEHKAWQILTAGADDELVADSGVCPGHSPFMGALLDGLRGEADENKDNLITALELNNYIQSRVSRETTKYGAKGQMPFFNYIAGSDLGNFVFLLPGYGKTDTSIRAERARKIRAILQDLSSNDVLPDPSIRKAERIIAARPEKLSKEDQPFDRLLDQLLKGDLKSKQFVSEWFRLAAKEEEWGGCISWDGDERSLPNGGQIRVPGLRIDKLVKKYVIVDTESDKGFREIKSEDLQPEMATIDAIINESLFNQLVLSWGKKAIMIVPSDRSEPLDRWEWKEKFDTDGLKLWIIKNAHSDSQSIGIIKNQASPTTVIPQSKPDDGNAALSKDFSEKKPEPELSSEWFEKGNALYNKGQYDEAIKAYDKAIGIYPKYVDAWNGKGNAFDNKGQYDEAIKAYDKAIDIDPEYARAWNNKGNVLKNQDQYDEAIKAYDKAIDIYPNYAGAWYNKGNALKALKRTKDAKVAFARAKKLGYKVLKNQAAPTTVISQSKSKDSDAALSKDSSELQPEPELSFEWFEKGNALYDQGQYFEAIKAYNKAIKIDPQYADAWNNKGLARYNQGQYNEAIKAYDKAIKIDPQYADAWNNKGLARHNQGQYDEAIQAYNKAIELDPKDEDYWNLKGNALYSQDKYDESIKAYDEAIRLNSSNPVFWNNKGEALKALKRTKEAKAAFSKAKELGYKG